MDTTEIDLDSLTTLELWEPHYLVAARLSRWEWGEPDQQSCHQSSFDTYAARARMKALV